MQRTQQQIRLVSCRPYDGLGRILDLLRKMEFELTELRLVNTSGMAEVTMSVLPLGNHSVDALLRSLGQIVGVTQIRADVAKLPDLSRERQWSTY